MDINDQRIVTVDSTPTLSIVKSNVSESGFLQSKFGGTPAMYDKMLLDDIKKLGTSAFICQINLNDLPYNPVLPKSGILQFWEEDFYEGDFHIVYIPIKDAVEYPAYESMSNRNDDQFNYWTDGTVIDFIKEDDTKILVRDNNKLISILEEKFGSDSDIKIGNYTSIIGRGSRFMELINPIHDIHMFGLHEDRMDGIIFDDKICILSIANSDFLDIGGTVGFFIDKKMTTMKPGIQDRKKITTITSAY